MRYVVPEEIWRVAALGTPGLVNGLTRTPAMLIEGLMTFFLVLVVFATSVDERGMLGRAAGFAAGLTVIAGALFGGPFTGGSMNPARAFGPALASRHWANHGVYWVGPLAGGVLAAWIYDSLFLRPSSPKGLTEDPTEEPLQTYSSYCCCTWITSLPLIVRTASNARFELMAF